MEEREEKGIAEEKWVKEAEVKVQKAAEGKREETRCKGKGRA